jgi:hypothetical protein
MEMETVTLRHIALQLAKFNDRKSRGINYVKLLGLLQSGQLKAGFYFPGREMRWVPIEPSYWQTVPSKKLKSVRRDGGEVFKVRIGDFGRTYVDMLKADRPESKKLSIESAMQEFEVALLASSESHEVLVPLAEWDRYLKGRGISESTGSKARGGRHPKAAWNELAVYIAAYLHAYHQKHKQPVNYETAAKEIHKFAIDDGIDPASLPASGTIKDVISKVYVAAQNILK